MEQYELRSELAKFEGYAIVEIMGHQRLSGYVKTCYFGNAAVFHVVQQEMPIQDETLPRDGWINGERVYAGTKVRVSRPRAETYVSAASLYRLTPCTEEEANADQPKVIEIVERATRPEISAPDPTIVQAEYDETEPF